MKNRFTVVLAVLALLVAFYGIWRGSAKADNSINYQSRPAGFYYALQYNWRGLLVAGNTSTGAVTVTIGYNTSLPDGRQFLPFGSSPLLIPVTFDQGANQETVTPTAVSYVTCPLTGAFGPQISCASFTGTFANTHGLNTVVTSGSLGLQEAIVDANTNGGGVVVVDGAWVAAGGVNTTITAVVLATPKVWVLSSQFGAPVWFGKSGTGAAAYSATNNDITSTGTASPFTKTFSQTYSVAPQCEASQTSGVAAALTVAPTTTNVVVTGTPNFAVHCDIVR